MTPSTWVLCSSALTFGAPLLAAGWELWHLGPIQWRPPPGEDVPGEPDPFPGTGVSPRGQKPLPDCLIPKRARELVDS